MASMNLTIEVPLGTTQHDNPRILCVQTPAWRTALLILTFFATNYFAHAATVKSTPGETRMVYLCNILLALVFPMSGLLRALNAIARLARFGRSELENACRAGALCMVVREEGWIPAKDDELKTFVVGPNDVLENPGSEASEDGVRRCAAEAELMLYLPSWAREDSSSWVYFDTTGARAYVDTKLTRIHGRYALPKGYSFAIVPRNACLRPVAPEQARTSPLNDVSSAYSLAKAVASTIQVLAAMETLLGHRSDLVDRFGYASYHLTVIPYLAMSILNFVSNMLTADYPCLFMVESETMSEARSRGGIFEGTLAALIPAESTHKPRTGDLVAWNGLDAPTLEAFVSKSNPSRLPMIIRDLVKEKPKSNNVDGTVMTLFCLGLQQIIGPSQPQQQVHDVVERQEPANYFSTESLILPAVARPPWEIGMLPSFALDSSHKRTMPKAILGPAQELHLHNLRHSIGVAFATTPQRSHPVLQVPVQATKPKYSTIRKLLVRGQRSFQPAVLLGFIAVDATFAAAPNGPLQHVADSTHEEVRRAIRRRKMQISHRLSLSLRAFSAVPGFGVTVKYLSGVGAVMLFLYGDDGESDRQVKSLTQIYVPACSGFLRYDDFAEDGSISHAMSTGALARDGLDKQRPVLLTGSRDRSARSMMFFLQCMVGFTILGLVLTLLGVLSDSFNAGKSTMEQRVIMMLWVCEGTFGLFFPWLSVKELLLVLLVLPVLGLLEASANDFLPSVGASAQAIKFLPFAISCVPLAAFVPPIWGFVLVVRMMLEWGTCIRLF